MPEGAVHLQAVPAPAVKIVSLNNRYLGMVRQQQLIGWGGRYAHSYMDALPRTLSVSPKPTATSG